MNEFIFCNELCGLEFDWYAIDLSGNVALFSTAGSGMIPEQIQPYIDDYSKVSMPQAKKGKNPWEPLSKAGITVFDMMDSDSYVKVSERSCETQDKIKHALERLPHVLKFNGHFESMDEIKDFTLFSLQNKEAVTMAKKIKP